LTKQTVRQYPVRGGIPRVKVPIGQWTRWRDWERPSSSLYFWQDRSGSEVDLVVDLDGRLHPIECKLTARPGASDAAGIRRMREFYGPDLVAEASIACLAEAPFDVAPGIVARPGWTAWGLTMSARMTGPAATGVSGRLRRRGDPRNPSP